MSFDDQTLMAFVDGELDAERAAAIERALAADAALSARVAVLRAQRRRVEAAFAPVLDEPMPDRLSGLLRGEAPAADGATVVPLAQARAARERRGNSAVAWGWAQWGGMAASVLIGLLLGLQFSGRGSDDGIAVRDGRLVAVGAVEHALSTQLASAAVAAPAVAVQLSFVDRDGAYCRTFSTAAVAGLACRADGSWAVHSVAAAASAPDGALRQAAAALPRAVLEAVDQRIAGNALVAAAERQARDGGWRR
jgi:anti-sigma factor RsiW